jgi:hypothetical protein
VDPKTQLQETVYALQQVSLQVYAHLHDPQANHPKVWRNGAQRGRFKIKRLGGGSCLFTMPTGEELLQLIDAYKARTVIHRRTQ